MLSKLFNVSGLIEWLFDRKMAVNESTVGIDLVGLEIPVRNIQCARTTGDRHVDCSLRWLEVDEILKATPNKDSFEFAQLKDARGAINAIAGTLFMQGEQKEYQIAKSNLKAVSDSIGLIYESAERYRLEPVSEHLLPEYKGNVVSLFNHKLAHIRNDQICFAPPVFVNRAPELMSFIDNFKAMIILLDSEPRAPEKNSYSDLQHKAF